MSNTATNTTYEVSYDYWGSFTIYVEAPENLSPEELKEYALKNWNESVEYDGAGVIYPDDILKVRQPEELSVETSY